jgi:hypothetical protein
MAWLPSKSRYATSEKIHVKKTRSYGIASQKRLTIASKLKCSSPHAPFVPAGSNNRTINENNLHIFQRVYDMVCKVGAKISKAKQQITNKFQHSRNKFKTICCLV